MFGATTNTNKFSTATGGPVLASGEHVTGGLVAAAAPRPVGRPRLGRWTARPVVSTLYALFFNLAPGLVAAPGIRKVYSCA